MRKGWLSVTAGQVRATGAPCAAAAGRALTVRLASILARHSDRLTWDARCGILPDPERDEYGNTSSLRALIWRLSYLVFETSGFASSPRDEFAFFSLGRGLGRQA